jgi:DUF4097 and DUF4098 domain-containing protein YvlB
MTDQDRILNLLAQGKISKEEAGELLEALDENEYSLAKPEEIIIDVTPIPPLPPIPEMPELPVPPVPPALVNVQKEIRETEKAISRLEHKAVENPKVNQSVRATNVRASEVEPDLHMVQLTSTSGDVSIIVDEDLKEPQFDSEGKIQIKRLVDNNWVVINHEDDLSVILPKNYGVVLVSDSGDVVIDGVPYVQGKISSGDVSAENIGTLDLVVDSGSIRIENIGLFQGKMTSSDLSAERVGNVDIVIDCGDVRIESSEQVRVVMTSGDLSVENAGLVDLIVDDGDISVNNAVMLRGKLTSGDVSFDHISGLDFVVDSGDISGSLLLKEGNHQLKVSSGDVSLEFLEGSSLQFSGLVTSGDIDINLPEDSYKQDKRRFEGKLGEGAASLSLNIDSGDVRLGTGKKSKRIKIDIDFDFDKLGFEGFGKSFFNFGTKGVETPPGLKWIYVDSWSGDVTISSDANLVEPNLNKGTLKRNESGDWKISSLTDDLNLVVPADFGVILSVKAGDVKVSHLPFIKGKVFAGDFKAQNIGGIDLFAAAGDIEASFLITEGNHHLTAAAGDLSLHFLKGSNLSFDGTNGPGILNKLGFTTPSYNGVVGDGRAKMTFRAYAGDIDISVETDEVRP